MDFAEGIHKLYSKKENKMLEILNRAIHCTIFNKPHLKLSQGVHTGFYFYIKSYRYMLIYDIEAQHWTYQRHPNALPVYPIGLSMKYNNEIQGYKANDSWYQCYLDKKFCLGEGAIPIIEDNIIKKYSLPTLIIDVFTSDYVCAKQYPLNNWDNIPKFYKDCDGRFYRRLYNIGKVAIRYAQKVLLKWEHNTQELGLVYFNENGIIAGNIEAINSIRNEYETIMDEISHIIKKGMLIPYESDAVNEYLLFYSETYDLKMYERGLLLFVQLLNNIGIDITQRELDETIRYTNTLLQYEEKSRLEVLYNIFKTHNEQLFKPIQSLLRLVSHPQTQTEKFPLYQMDEGILTYLAFLHHTYSKKK